MATQRHYTGNTLTQTDTAAANNTSSTLPAPGAGMAWRIDHISFFAGGAAITAWTLEVQENGGTTIWKAGATTAVYPGQFTGPIATKVNDAPVVVQSSAGATSVQLNVIATLVSGGA